MPNARELLSFLRNKGNEEVRILQDQAGKTLVVPVYRGKDSPKGLFLRILKDTGFAIEDFR